MAEEGKRIDNKVVWIKVGLLDIDPRIKRDAYDPEIFRRLVSDIKEHGFRADKPLSVRPNPSRKGYLINCGQHRFEAGLKAGIKEFPSVIKDSQTDVEALTEAYKDNAIAGSLDAITEAKMFQEIGKEILKKAGSVNGPELGNRLRDKIAIKTGVTSNYVNHRLPLLKLPRYVQDMVKRYYQPSLKGSKLSPTIAEELYLTQRLIKTQNEAEIVEKTDEKEAIKFLSTLYSIKRTSLVDSRKIKADIAVRGFEEWKKREEADEQPKPPQNISCFVCGANVADSPWRPLCPEHISMLDEIARAHPEVSPVTARNLGGRKPSIFDAMNRYRDFEELVHNVYSKRQQKIPPKVLDSLEKLRQAYRPISDNSRGYVV